MRTTLRASDYDFDEEIDITSNLQPIILESDIIGLASKFRIVFERLPGALNTPQIFKLFDPSILTPEILNLLESPNYNIIIPVSLSVNGYGKLYSHENLIRMLFATDVIKEFCKEYGKEKPTGHDYYIIRKRIARGFDPSHQRSKYIERINSQIQKHESLPFVYAKPEDADGIDSKSHESEGDTLNNLEQ